MQSEYSYFLRLRHVAYIRRFHELTQPLSHKHTHVHTHTFTHTFSLSRFSSLEHTFMVQAHTHTRTHKHTHLQFVQAISEQHLKLSNAVQLAHNVCGLQKHLDALQKHEVEETNLSFLLSRFYFVTLNICVKQKVCARVHF